MNDDFSKLTPRTRRQAFGNNNGLYVPGKNRPIPAWGWVVVVGAVVVLAGCFYMLGVGQ